MDYLYLNQHNLKYQHFQACLGARDIHSDGDSEEESLAAYITNTLIMMVLFWILGAICRSTQSVECLTR